MAGKVVLSDRPVGPVHRYFAWRPTQTAVGTKWFVQVKRQLWERTLWMRYWEDLTHGNGGGEFVEKIVVQRYWKHASCGETDLI